jgi:hypothetical protein
MCKCTVIVILLCLSSSLLIIYLDNNTNLGSISNIKYIEHIELKKNTLDLWNFEYSNSQIILKNWCPSKTRNFNIFYQGKLLAFVSNFGKKQSSRSNIQNSKKKVYFKIFESGEIFINETKTYFWMNDKILNLNNFTLATIQKENEKIKIYNMDNELDTVLLLGLAGRLVMSNQDICNQYFLSVSIFLGIVFLIYVSIKIISKKFINKQLPKNFDRELLLKNNF